MPCGVSDLEDRAIEGRGVCLRWFGRSADLPHVLEGGGVHLVIGCFRFKIVELVNVPAHTDEDNSPGAAAEAPASSLGCGAAGDVDEPVHPEPVDEHAEAVAPRGASEWFGHRSAGGKRVEEPGECCRVIATQRE